MSIKATQIRFKKDAEKFEYYGELVHKGELKASAQGTLVYGKMRIGKELVRIKAGDSIQEGVTLARIIDLNKPLVRLFVHEIDAGLIQKGLKARVNLDAYPEQVYSAEVSKIVPVAKKKFENDRNNLRGFDVEVRILKGDKYLKPGMTANVEIIQQVYSQVIAIPSQAIFREEKHDFCWVESESGLEKRALQVGISTELMSAIKSGLTPGDRVVLNPEEVSL